MFWCNGEWEWRMENEYGEWRMENGKLRMKKFSIFTSPSIPQFQFSISIFNSQLTQPPVRIIPTGVSLHLHKLGNVLSSLLPPIQIITQSELHLKPTIRFNPLLAMASSRYFQWRAFYIQYLHEAIANPKVIPGWPSVWEKYSVLFRKIKSFNVFSKWYVSDGL